MMKFARWMVRHPIVVIAANLFVTVILGFYALHIRVEFSTASVLPAGDPQVEYYAKVREIFGSDDIAIVGVRADDIFASSTLEKIARVTDALAKIKGVSWVASITNAPDLTEDPFGKKRLLRRIPPSRGEIEAVQKKLAAAPVLGKNLLADDYRGPRSTCFSKTSRTPSTPIFRSTVRSAMFSPQRADPSNSISPGWRTSPKPCTG